MASSRPNRLCCSPPGPAVKKRDGWPWSSLASAIDPSVLREHSLPRSEEHTSELQSRLHLVCRLLLEKKKKVENHAATANVVSARHAHKKALRATPPEPIGVAGYPGAEGRADLASAAVASAVAMKGST